MLIGNDREVEIFSKLLLQNGIEVESKQKTNILKSNYVRFIIDLLKIIDEPYTNEEKFINIFRNSINGINNVDIFKINRELYKINYSKKHKVKFIDYLNIIEAEKEEKQKELNLQDLEKIIILKNKIIDYKSKLSEIGLKDFIGFLIKDLKIIEFIEENGDFDDIQDIYTFFNKIKEFIENNKFLNIEKLLNKINLFENYNISIPRQILKENKSGVQILTAHSSKGLEYNSVFVTGLYTGNWEGKKVRDLLKLPIYISGNGLQSENFEQIEEDRRLFFVAVTRARENLFLSYPSSSGNKILLQSIFLEEINDSFKEIEQEITEVDFKEIVENEIKNDLIKNGDLELEYIEEFLKTYKISASDLNIFLENPMIFLQRVVYKYPFEENQFTVFGKAYHRTLELFYLKYKKENKIPEKSYLNATFKYLLEREVLTEEEFEKLLEKGIEGLNGYYDLYSRTSKIPLELEYNFRRKNIFFEEIPITGVIDKIEKNEGGVIQNNIGDGFGQFSLFKESVNLIDYKTGKVKSLGQIKGIDKFGNKKETPGEGNYFRQLLFYKLLCEMDYETNSKYEIGGLLIDFVEGKDSNYKIVQVDYTDEDYENFKQELKDSWLKINNINFWKETLKKEEK
ncbi:hypothetical protein DLH72_00040 [Candidatus Gracilibacteria bacterium]|nr:MAG: hypothetical protein DLH72_00040 [Candidatus Gracilibacteria bacterium]